MEQCSALEWIHYAEQQGMTELKRFLVEATLELESAVTSAQDQILRKQDEVAHVSDLLTAAIKERDQARFNCQQLLLEKVFLQHQVEQLKNTQKPSSSEESIVSDQAPECPSPERKGRLPEKGRLLQAVMEAGPTLQTLMLAGPLPQWRHPPPQMDAVQIPPVTVPASPPVVHQDSFFKGKRGLETAFDGSVSSSHTCSKHQKLIY